MGYNRPLIPGCKINLEDNTIVCDAKKILRDKVVVGDRPIKFTIDNNQLFTLDDGGNPEQLVKDVQVYIKRIMVSKRV